MLTVPALKLQQFAMEFYLLNLASADVERVVRFEVLEQADVQGNRANQKNACSATKKGSLVNWDEIERKVRTSERAYQRPILRQKVDEPTPNKRSHRWNH